MGFLVALGFFHSEGKLQGEVTTSFLPRPGACCQPGTAGDRQLEQSHGAVCPADPAVPTVHICCSDESTHSKPNSLLVPESHSARAAHG